jgi:hypothetical protein
MRMIIATIVTASTLLAPTLSSACGEWPAKHGGQMNYGGGEVAFELVSKGRQVTLYLEDHGVPIPAFNAQGILKVSQVSKGWSLAMRPAGDNRFTATLPAPLQKGDEVTADFSFKNGSIAQGRFVIGVEVQTRTRFGQARPADLPAFK